MEVTGKIKLIKEEAERGTFKMRDVVVTSDEQYPQHIIIQFVQDKCDLLNNFQVGDAVKVDINLRGREWVNPEGESVYFNTIQGWRIFKQDDSKQSPPPNTAETKTNTKEFGAALPGEEEPDDLPF